jgi:hypothetical protein
MNDLSAEKSSFIAAFRVATDFDDDRLILDLLIPVANLMSTEVLNSFVYNPFAALRLRPSHWKLLCDAWIQNDGTRMRLGVRQQISHDKEPPKEQSLLQYLIEIISNNALLSDTALERCEEAKQTEASILIVREANVRVRHYVQNSLPLLQTCLTPVLPVPDIRCLIVAYAYHESFYKFEAHVAIPANDI